MPNLICLPLNSTTDKTKQNQISLTFPVDFQPEVERVDHKSSSYLDRMGCYEKQGTKDLKRSPYGMSDFCPENIPESHELSTSTQGSLHNQL